MNIDELKQREKSLLEREKLLANGFNRRKQAAFDRFPLVFTLLGSFGLVATFYGFEGLIDQIDYFADKPLALLLTGIITLVLTGTLYKKL